MIEVIYEHDEWFEPLFRELDRRHIDYLRMHVAYWTYDPDRTEFPLLALNRMSPSAWRRKHRNAIFTVRDYIGHLEENGVPVINGSNAYAVEISKARQLDLFRRCGVQFPRARVLNHSSQVMQAARGLQYPLVFKPNIGGSGAGIVRFDTADQLASAKLDFGVDGTALIQEFLPARGESIVRVEILDGEFLYAIRIYPDLTSFNLCPADICQVEDAAAACPAPSGKRRLRIERADPPAEAIEGAKALAKAAALDVGGIEYLVNDRDGSICYYDINALSNFVQDAVSIVGFDPTARFVDYLERRLAAAGSS